MNRMLNVLSLFIFAATSVWAGRGGGVVQKSPLTKISFNAPFEACKKVPLLTHDDYAKDEAFWIKEKTYCGYTVQVLPDTGFLNTVLSKMGEKEDIHRSYDFLSKVKERALKNLQSNIQYSQEMVDCAREKSPKTKKCEELLKYERDNAAKHRPELRQKLALSRYKILLATDEMPKSEMNINTDLNGVPNLISAPMEKLTDEEFKTALATYNSDTSEIEAEWMANNPKWKAPTQAEIDKALRQTRFGIVPDQAHKNFIISKRHEKQATKRAEYLDLLMASPLLAYMGEKEMSDEAIAKAGEKLLSNGQSEEKKLKSLIQEINSLSYPQTMDPEERIQKQNQKMLELMQYGSVVNEILAEDSSACNTATGLVNYISNTDLRNNVAFMAGMLGGTTLLAAKGVAALATIGVTGWSSAALTTIAVLPVSASSYYDSYKKAKSTEASILNAPETGLRGKKLITIDEYKKAQSDLVINFALAGTGMDLWGSGLGKAGAIAAAGFASGKFFEKQAAKTALKTALAEKGKNEKEIITLIQDLNQADQALSSKAAANIIKELQLDPDEIKLIRLAASKGFLGSEGDNLPYLKLLLKDLPQDKIERKLATYEALKIFQALNPTKMSEVAKERTTRAILAAAKFGELDPNRIALMINTWEGSIDGLTKTYLLASSKIKTPELLAITNTVQRKELAFQNALDELLAKNPSFMKLAPKEKTKIAKALGNCGMTREAK